MKKTARSQNKIKLNNPLNLPHSQKEILPLISARETINPDRNVSLSVKLPSKKILNSPAIEKSAKNLLLMRKINVLNESYSSEDAEEQRHILKRLESGKQQKILPELVVLTKNTNRQSILKQPYIHESLIGEEAVQKFYQRYKQLDRRKDQQDFFNQKHAITSIVNLLQIHNFTPRKLTIVKLKGEQAILDLKKLGIGQGSMGPAVIEIINFLPQFQTIDLSHNRIDGVLGQNIIEKLGKTKNVNLSHNRIGKTGCLKFAQLFLTSTTKIQELLLEENNLVDNAGVSLVEHLLRYNNLKKLNLNKNFMGDKFAQKMRSFLKEDRQLQQLYLSWNEFTSKGVKAILEGLTEHADLKVFDFSWNKIEFENIPILAKIFAEVPNLIHADFAFCEIGLKSIEILSKALSQNHTLFGVHFEGNSGFVDNRGFLIHTQKEFNEYPLPIIKGIIRKIDGVKPNPNNEYKVGSMRDVCWICHSWQQRYFSIDYTPQMKQQAKSNPAGAACYIHFKHQNYRAVKMFLAENNTKFQIERMCPLGLIHFFFTFTPMSGKRYTTFSAQFQTKQTNLQLDYFIGKIDIHDVVKEMNYTLVGYNQAPLDDSYQPNIDLQPRAAEVGINYNKGQRIKVKRKVLREQKVKVNLKDLGDDEDDDFLKDKLNRDDDYVILGVFRLKFIYLGIHQLKQEYLRKCLEFDLQNSKIYKLIKEESDLNKFKFMMMKYYRCFKDAFYYLSRGNPSLNGIYSISELDFNGFVQEQKYTTKRVTQAKIMLKYYACISAGDEAEVKNKSEGMGSKKPEEKANNKLLSRPQFLQFLIRLAIQKWCSFNPNKKKKPFVDQQKLWQEQQKKMLQMKRNNSKMMFKSQKSQKMDLLDNNSKKMSQKQKSIKQTKKTQEQRKKIDEESSSQDQKEEQMKKLKLKLPLPLVDGIQKTMTSLVRYAENYRSSTWRKNKYLKVDNLFVLKAYDQFLNALFEKYTQVKFKTNKPKKLTNLLTLDELKNIFFDTGIRKTKEAMKQMQQDFLNSKRLQVQDGNLQYGLCFEEFQECIARISEYVWFNPPAAPNAPLWDKQINRKNTPLFVKFESLVVALYWKTPDLHNRRMTKIAQKGIFQLQMGLIMQKVEQLSSRSGNLGLNRLNSILGEEEINLKDIIDELREKYDKMVVYREQEEEVEQQVHPS